MRKAYDLTLEEGNIPTENLLRLMESVYQELEEVDNQNKVIDELKEHYPGYDQLEKTPIANSRFRMQAASGDYLPIVKVQPIYPRRALSRGIEGYAIVEFTITKQGTTKDVGIVDGKPEYIFDNAAIQAVEKFKYKPRVVDGEPVEVAGIRTRIEFILEKDDETEKLN